MTDEFMRAAIDEARAGLTEKGIPIGSVLIKNGQIVGRGHNKRVQDGDPITHAEIDCLRNAGRVGSYKNTVLYSTLMPCYLCAGAVVQFGIKKVIVGESQTFQGGIEWLRENGVEVIDMDSAECIEMLGNFIAEYPEVWNEDIGKD